MNFFYGYISQSESQAEHFYVGSTENIRACLKKNTMQAMFLTHPNFDRGESKLQLPSQTAIAR